ncbi:MAG: hypothetical protein K940chlam3_00396 [Chlamydiae bacterium]|nr:hypothetical protein [Chlamydiota bacterium]
MLILSLAFIFFIVANPIGNGPVMLAIIKDFDYQHQKRIMWRESVFAFFLALFFQFFGEVFLGTLHVAPYTLTYCGGILLFLVAISMIFPVLPEQVARAKKEPFFVPIATPLISGPGLMTVIMAKSQDITDWWVITAAIALSWIPVTFALVGAPMMLKVLKRRGMIALEQLMGMILMLISVEMFVSATMKYINS